MEIVNPRASKKGKAQRLLIQFCCFFTCIISHSLFGKSDVSMEEYSKMIGEVDAVRNKIATRNHHGSAYCFYNELTERFLTFCRTVNTPTHVLEIGAAYGIKSSQIVQTGVDVTALDLEEEHLILARRAFARLSECYPCFLNCHFVCGNFLSLDLEQLSSQPFDAILIESVLHFMTPDEVERAIIQISDFLKPSGKVFLIVSSPFCQHFIDFYQTQKKAGSPWPGFIADPEELSPSLRRLHKPYHTFDIETLTREFKKCGFEICESGYTPIPHREFDIALDGREGLFLVAEKHQTLHSHHE